MPLSSELGYVLESSKVGTGYYNPSKKGSVYTLVGPFRTEREAVVNYAVTMDRRAFEKEIRGEHRRMRLPIPSYFQKEELEGLLDDPKGYGYDKVIVKKPSTRIHKSWNDLAGDARDFVEKWLW